MLKVLFADDQIPDDAIPDGEIRKVLAEQHHDWSKPFINAFVVMREAVRTLRNGCDVTVARSVNEALRLVEKRRFDVAIIDLGWFGDHEVTDADKPAAGWKIADAIDIADSRRPERAPTAQIIYSARFVSHPEISIKAAQKGKLPFFKPYGERYSIPSLDSIDEAEHSQRKAAYHALQAAVSFIEHLLTASASSPRERRWEAANKAWENAVARDRKWDLLTRVLVTAGIGLIFLGVFAAFFLGVGEGIVTSASGVLISLIPKLLYSQLNATRQAILEAKKDIERALASVDDG